MAKTIFEKTVNGQTYLIAATMAQGNQGAYVLTLVKPGNPFWWFNSIPTGKVIACDFSNAPICGNTAAENNALIAAITVQPEEVLTYE